MCTRMVLVLDLISGEYREAESDDPCCSCSNVVPVQENDEEEDAWLY